MGTTIKKLDVKITTDNSKLKSGLKQSTQSVNKFSSSLKKMGGIMAGAFAITKVASFFKSTIKLYGIQEQAEKKLADSIAATGGVVDELLPRYKNLASAIQNVTTVGDEVTLGLIALGKQMGISDAKMEEATKGAIGLSKAFGIDLNTSMKMVAAGIQGDTTLLNRYIPQLRFATTQAEKMSIMNTAMANGWIVATGEAETFTGKMEQLTNTMGDIKEKIGGAIAETMTEPLKELSTWVTENQDGIVQFFKDMGSAIAFAFGGLKLIITYTQALSVFSKTKDRLLEINKDEMQLYLDLRNSLESYGAKFLDINDAMKDYNGSLFEQLVQVRKNIKEYPKLIDANQKLIEARRKVGEETQKETDKIDALNKKLAKEKAAKEKAAKATEKFTKYLKSENGQWGLLIEKLPKARADYQSLAPPVTDLTTATNALTTANESLGGGLGDIGSDFNVLGENILGVLDIFSELTRFVSGEFADALNDIGGIVQSALSGDIFSAAIQSISFLSEAFAGFLSGFGESEDSRKRTEETNKKNEEEIRKQLLSLGLNEEQMKKVSNLYVDGVINIEALVASLTGFGFSLADIIASIPKIGIAIEGEPGTPTPQTDPIAPTLPGRGFASGGSFVVPQGFNENFQLGNVGAASSGEEITVTPQGESGRDINVNMFPAKDASSSDLMKEFIQGYRLNLHNVQGEIG